MTPKEQAKELVEKIYYCQRYEDGEDYIPLEAYKRAKQCTLIAVNEILKSGIEQDYYFDKSIGYYLSYIEYYEEVKQEIKKL